MDGGILMYRSVLIKLQVKACHAPGAMIMILHATDGAEVSVSAWP